MKELYIIRHAKASEDYITIQDYDRPLKSRGVLQAHKISSDLKEKKVLPDLIIASPAARALQTAHIFAANLGYPLEKIQLNKSVYEAYVENLLAVLEEVNDDVQKVFLVGHNPSMTHLANYLLDSHTNEIPTCGIVCVHLNVDSWKKLAQNKHQLAYFIFPLKKVMDKITEEKQLKISSDKPIDDAPKV